MGHLIALIFREDKFHPQIKVPGIVARALDDINADVLTVPREPLHAQGVAHVPGGAEFQTLSLRFQAILFRQFLCLGIHDISVGVPVAFRQGARFAHFLAVGCVFGFEGVKICARLIGVGAFQSGHAQGGGVNGVGVFHVYPVYQRIVPLFRSRSDFYVFQFQHVDNGAPHQQKQQRDQRRN